MALFYVGKASKNKCFKAILEIKEDKRMLIGSSFKSLGAIIKKALTLMCEELGRGKIREEGGSGG